MNPSGDNGSPGDGRLHRADPAHRRRMQALLIVAILIGAAVLVALNLWLRQLDHGVAPTDIDAYHRWLARILAGICVLLALPAAAFGTWLWRLAQATRRDRRWPPVGYRSSADVRIRYLTSADALVAQLRAGAFALFAAAAGLAAWAAWLFRTA